jgi:hypothetical protein
VGAELFLAGRTEKNDEANNRWAGFAKVPENKGHLLVKPVIGDNG